MLLNEQYRRTSSCSGGSLVWSAWTDTGSFTPYSNTCHAPSSCTPQPPQYKTSLKNAGCTGGWVGTRIVNEKYQRTSSCSGGSLVWSAWTDTGSFTPYSNTCHAPAATCTPQAPQTKTEHKTVGCPAGMTGSKVLNEIYRRTSSCQGGSLMWSGYSDTGQSQSVASNSCVLSVQPYSMGKVYGRCSFGGRGGYFQSRARQQWRLLSSRDIFLPWYDQRELCHLWHRRFVKMADFMVWRVHWFGTKLSTTAQNGPRMVKNYSATATAVYKPTGQRTTITIRANLAPCIATVLERGRVINIEQRRAGFGRPYHCFLKESLCEDG